MAAGERPGHEERLRGLASGVDRATPVGNPQPQAEGVGTKQVVRCQSGQNGIGAQHTVVGRSGGDDHVVEALGYGTSVAAAPVLDDDAIGSFGRPHHAGGGVSEASARLLSVEHLLHLRRHPKAMHVPKRPKVPQEARALTGVEVRPDGLPLVAHPVDRRLPAMALEAVGRDRGADAASRARAVDAGGRTKSAALRRAGAPCPRDRSPRRDRATISPPKP